MPGLFRIQYLDLGNHPRAHWGDCPLRGYICVEGPCAINTMHLLVWRTFKMNSFKRHNPRRLIGCAALSFSLLLLSFSLFLFFLIIFHLNFSTQKITTMMQRYVNGMLMYCIDCSSNGEWTLIVMMSACSSLCKWENGGWYFQKSTNMFVYAVVACTRRAAPSLLAVLTKILFTISSIPIDYKETYALCIGHSQALPRNLHHHLEKPSCMQPFHTSTSMDGRIKL